MANNKRNVWDELVELGREIIDNIEAALDPKSPKNRKPARVPIPVRNNPRRRQPNPYEQD